MRSLSYGSMPSAENIASGRQTQGVGRRAGNGGIVHWMPLSPLTPLALVAHLEDRQNKLDQEPHHLATLRMSTLAVAP